MANSGNNKLTFSVNSRPYVVPTSAGNVPTNSQAFARPLRMSTLMLASPSAEKRRVASAAMIAA